MKIKIGVLGVGIELKGLVLMNCMEIQFIKIRFEAADRNAEELKRNTNVT